MPVMPAAPVMAGDAPVMQPLPGQPPRAAPIRVALPVPQVSPTGELFVQPNVAPAAALGTFAASPAEAYLPGVGSVVAPASLQGAESLPPPPAPGLQWPGEPPPSAAGTPSGLPEGILSSDPTDLIWGSAEPLVPWEEFHRVGSRPISPTGDPGLGRERVMCAPFEIDITQTFGNFLLRSDMVYNLTKPDRAEFFWARPGRGPLLPERGVDYQDFRFRLETGNDAFSLATDIPIRLLNPEVNGNNGGISDIELVQKTVMMNGGRWQMTQLLRTIFNSGNARKGLGTGHVAMEPGLLCRYKWSDITYLHGQVKLRFPLGGTPIYSGPGWTWGIGVSTIWWETDTFALMPTLEFINLYILDGQVLPPGGGAPIDVRGDGIYNLAPGIRTVWDTGGDLGVVEFGVGSVLAIGSDGWYDSLLRVDLRFVF